MKKNLLYFVLGLCSVFMLSSNLAIGAETDSTLVAPHLSAKIDVDGTIDAAWDAIPFSKMNNKLTDGAVGAVDFSVKFKVGWFGNFIYTLIDITDNVIVADTVFDVYKQDYSMIYMDLVKDSASYKDLNSFYYRINSDKSKIDGRFNDNWAPPSVGVVAEPKTRKGGYVVEYGVDVTKFGLTKLNGGEVIGFDIEVGDNDDAAIPQRTSQYIWSTSSTGNDWDSPLGEVGYITLGLSTGISNNQGNVEMNLFPNPASSQIQLSSYASKIEIYNITGSRVLTVNEVSANSPINVSGLKGIYLVKATAQNGNIVTKKLMIN